MRGRLALERVPLERLPLGRLPLWEDCHWEDCHCGKIATGKIATVGRLPPNLKIDEHLNLKYFGESNRKRNTFV